MTVCARIAREPTPFRTARTNLALERVTALDNVQQFPLRIHLWHSPRADRLLVAGVTVGRGASVGDLMVTARRSADQSSGASTSFSSWISCRAAAASAVGSRRM